jgi:hypothetical protein
MILERVFEMVWWRGRKLDHIKKDFSVFLLSKCYLPLYLKRLLELFLLHLLRTWGFDDIWGENHFFKNFFSNGFNILAVDAYSGMELYMPTWQNHDYWDGGSCGYNGSGRIFQSGCMHANVYGWG